MINNRQAGRRRGRNNNNSNNGGPRQNGGGGNRGNGDSGNRIDNRARGNAAQLLEKYRNMARDAQLVGDRVNMEYNLQFADHYFRVLADNRARQEEQQGGQQRFQRFDGNDPEEEFSPDDDGFGDLPEVGGRQRDDFRRDENRGEPVREENRREDNRGNRDDFRRDDNRGNRDDNRGNRDDNRANREEPRSNREEGRREEGRANRDDTRVGRDEPRVNRENPNRENRRPVRDRSTERSNDEVSAETALQVGEAERNPRTPIPSPAPAFVEPANDEGRDEPRPRATRGRKPRVREAEAGEPQESGLDAAVLPPAIGRPAPASADTDDAEPVAPVRRIRRPRAPAQAAE